MTRSGPWILGSSAPPGPSGTVSWPSRLVVGVEAGSLEVQPGLQVVDVEGFAERLPESLGVPPDYVKVVLAHREALNLYRLSNRNWTYLSPSAGLITSGERTGRFRTGGN